MVPDAPAAFIASAPPVVSVETGAVTPEAPWCGGAPSTSAPSCGGDAAAAAALACIPRELVGHVAELDPGQLEALTRMPPLVIARSVRGLAGMDDDKATAFGEVIGNLSPSALHVLAVALPGEAKKYRGAAGFGASSACGPGS
jgi:hypothetical protein